MNTRSRIIYSIIVLNSFFLMSCIVSAESKDLAIEITDKKNEKTKNIYREEFERASVLYICNTLEVMDSEFGYEENLRRCSHLLQIDYVNYAAEKEILKVICKVRKGEELVISGEFIRKLEEEIESLKVEEVYNVLVIGLVINYNKELVSFPYIGVSDPESVGRLKEFIIKGINRLSKGDGDYVKKVLDSCDKKVNSNLEGEHLPELFNSPPN